MPEKPPTLFTLVYVPKLGELRLIQWRGHFLTVLMEDGRCTYDSVDTVRFFKKHRGIVIDQWEGG